MEACTSCGVFICTLCNEGTRCADGCGKKQPTKTSTEPVSFSFPSSPFPSTFPSSFPSLIFPIVFPLPPPKIKSEYEARVWPPEETVIFDSVRMPETDFPIYGFVHDIEVGEGRGQEGYVKIVFFAIKARWFDELPYTLSKVTPEWWHEAADDAEPCHIHIGASDSLLSTIISKVGGQVSFGRGMWLKLWIAELEETATHARGVPATVYFPVNRRVASIGLAGPAPVDYQITRIERVRPTRDGLFKLRLFKRKISV